MEERIQKIIAAAGIASRRKCEELISEGRVTVNGRTAKLGEKADPEKDDIHVDGERIAKAELKKYYVVNKPRGVLSTVSDPFGRMTIMQLVPQGARVFPVGRLDKDSEGLVLMTNDGRIANILMHPRYETPKTYNVTLARDITQKDVRKLKKGVRIGWRRVVPEKIAVHTSRNVAITIHEGRKHIVKIIFKKLGYNVVRLKRTKMANITLGTLPSGACRELTKAELAGLQRLASNAE
ncbi:MAG: pseudouridine synthase [Candidatus Woesearchaeota archaeon]